MSTRQKILAVMESNAWLTQIAILDRIVARQRHNNEQGLVSGAIAIISPTQATKWLRHSSQLGVNVNLQRLKKAGLVVSRPVSRTPYHMYSGGHQRYEYRITKSGIATHLGQHSERERLIAELL